MRIIAIANHKGGCGKTTSAINFAACLAHLKKRVLIMDMDPQGHSTCGLGIKGEELPYTLYDLMRSTDEKRVPGWQLIRKVQENLFIVPSYGILGAIEEELANVDGRERRLGEKLPYLLDAPYQFDYVILDCPPNLGLLTYNALEVADEVIVPIEPSFFSLHGLGKMMETIQATQERVRKEIDVHALLTIFDSSLSFSEEVYEDVRTHFGEKLFKSIIHQDVAFKEAAGAGQSIVDYDLDSRACQDYLGLAVEYLERDWNRLLPKRNLGWDNVLRQRFGPKRVAGGILFQAMSEKAKWVEVAGDFNQWIPEPMIRRDRDGLWQKVVPLSQGSFRYKFIIDGEWQIDPYQQEQINQYGGTDSFLEIA